jgi:sugar phosphate isomerase/epimerase
VDRKTFLHASTGVAAGLLTPSCAPKAAPVAGGTMDQIGVQLYTVRDHMAESVPRTLGQVAEIGYTEVEFAGYFGHTPEEIREFLDEVSLSAPALHIDIGAVREDLDGIISAAQTIGHQYVIVPFLSEADRPDIDGYRRLADEFNALGERCNAAGLRFGYHNHAFEFEQMGDELPYDVLLNRTEPELVTMEMDLFWTQQGGQDPLAYFSRFPGRFELCHVKDMDADGNMVDVGQGIMDFSGMFGRSSQAGLKHYFVEHDQPEASLASIERSYTHLSTLTY